MACSKYRASVPDTMVTRYLSTVLREILQCPAEKAPATRAFTLLKEPSLKVFVGTFKKERALVKVFPGNVKFCEVPLTALMGRYHE